MVVVALFRDLPLEQARRIARNAARDHMRAVTRTLKTKPARRVIRQVRSTAELRLRHQQRKRMPGQSSMCRRTRARPREHRRTRRTATRGPPGRQADEPDEHDDLAGRAAA